MVNFAHNRLSRLEGHQNVLGLIPIALPFTLPYGTAILQTPVVKDSLLRSRLQLAPRGWHVICTHLGLLVVDVLPIAVL